MTATEQAHVAPAGTAVGDLDLDDLTVEWRGTEPVGGDALLLVRRAGRPVGLVSVEVPEPLAVGVLAERASAAAPRGGPPVSAVVPGGTALSATAVICTLGTHPRLRAAVQSVLAQQFSDLDVLVVDNAPGSGATARALEGVDDPRLRIVAERRRGLAHARNRALASTRRDVVAFTDDDALADPLWLQRLMEVFAQDTQGVVDAVTGLVVPGELRTPAQRHFEQYGGFGKGFRRQVWAADPHDPRARGLGELAPHGPLFPYTTGKVGSGNNMAFRRSTLDRLGGFDVALGAGTVTLGGEDLDAFSRVLLDGGLIVYTPDSLVWHYHRATSPELVTQIKGNGVGMSAILTKTVVTRPSALPVLVGGSVRMARNAFSPKSERNAGKGPDFPRELMRAEVLGLLAGPWAWLRSRRTERRGGGG